MFTAPMFCLISGFYTPIMTRPGDQDFYKDINLQFANQPVQNGDQMGPGLVNPSNKNCGPRIGLAYSPGPHWSIRAGFGIFYVQDIGETEFRHGAQAGGKDGNVIANNTRTTTLACSVGHRSGQSGVPGLYRAVPGSAAASGYYQGNTTPYVEQYMFVVQRELSSEHACGNRIPGQPGTSPRLRWSS